MRSFRFRALSCSAVALVMGGTGAAAQEAPPTAERSEVARDDDSTSVVADIIVTATRRNERIQNVPGQVSALSGDALDRLRAKTLADFAAYTPGVSFESTTPSTNRIAIRGVTTGGTQLNSGIGLYLDDVPIGSSTPFGAGAQAISIGLFDLQRVEVLNGPQGTLFGANALGGTVRYITEAPKLGALAGRAEGEFGYTEKGDVNWATRAAVNVPMGDRTALRVDGVVSRDSGYADDPGHGRSNQGDARLLAGRASFLFEPTGDVKIRLTGFAQRVRSDGTAVVFRDPVTHAPTAGVYDQSYASEQPSQTELYVGHGTVDWNLGFANLSSVTAYQSNRYRSTRDFEVPYTAIAGRVFGPAGAKPYIVPADMKTRRFTQEVRLASPSNKSFEWVVGAFYSHENTTQEISALNSADPDGKLLGFTLGRFFLPSKAREFALFGNVTAYLTPRLDASGGIRQSWNHQVFTTNGVGLFINPSAPSTPITSTGTSDESVRTYLFNLRWRPVDGTMLYARVASGYRPGGPNLIIGGVGTGNTMFNSDSLWNYELGLKQSFAGNRGFFNLSGYHIDWSDIQQVRNVGGINQLTNAGDAKIDGVEASTSYRIVPGFTLLASATYTNARLTAAAPILGITYAGARLPLTPKFGAAIAVNYDFDLGDWKGGLNVSLRHVGERNAGYPGSAVAPLYRLAAYRTVDATLSLRSADGWEIGPYVKNLFNVRGEVSAATSFNQYVPTTPVAVTISLPRTYGIVVGRSF